MPFASPAYMYIAKLRNLLINYLEICFDHNIALSTMHEI